MLYCDFEQLKDYILSKNTYLHRGFAHAYKDTVLHAIHVKDGNGLINVLPNDSFWNYFYLRNEHGIRHEALPAERLSDSGAQRLSFLDTITVYLVVVVKDAEPFQLIENLRNTAMGYPSLNVIPVSSNWNREQVLMEELAGRKQDEVLAVLQRLTNETIVKLTLNISKQFVPGNCINNPCKP